MAKIIFTKRTSNVHTSPYIEIMFLKHELKMEYILNFFYLIIMKGSWSILPIYFYYSLKVFSHFFLPLNKWIFLNQNGLRGLHPLLHTSHVSPTWLQDKTQEAEEWLNLHIPIYMRNDTQKKKKNVKSYKF